MYAAEGPLFKVFPCSVRPDILKNTTESHCSRACGGCAVWQPCSYGCPCPVRPNRLVDITELRSVKHIVAVQYGEDAVKEGMGGGGPSGPGGMSDLFDILSGGGGRGGRQRERRGENVVHRLKVSLEEIYNGGTR